MNKISKLAIAVLVVAGMIFSASSAFTAPTQMGDVKAEIVGTQPVSLQHVSGAALSFGNFTSPISFSGSVTVSQTTGVRSLFRVLAAPGGTVSRDKFVVTGGAGRTFSITGPTAVVITTPATATLPASGLSLNISRPSSGTIGSTAPNINAMFDVGGSLTIPVNQRFGVYTGTYSVTVAYN